MAKKKDDKARTDATFEGLYQAAGVPLSDDEKARLRTAYDSLAGLARRVRREDWHWEDRMLPLYTPKRTHRTS